MKPDEPGLRTKKNISFPLFANVLCLFVGYDVVLIKLRMIFCLLIHRMDDQRGVIY